jgi:TatD DNase family protein
MEIIDTHTHLYLDQFDDDFDEMIQRSFDCGVKKFVFPSISSKYNEKMVSTLKKFPKNFFLMAGLHPVYVKDDYQNELKIVKENLGNYKCVAVGEIGIDKHWDVSFLKQQKIAFQTQIDIAKEKDLPVVIHCRDAFNDIYDILIKNESEKLRGILHCFTGSLDDAKKLIDLNFKIGIGGVVTFKNGGIDKFLNQIDISNIVLETDSPYLAPSPHRGKRNESSYIAYVIDKLSEIYGLSTLDIINQTSLNANDVFDFNK